MSGLSLPVTRPSGRALVVAAAAARSEPIAQLNQLGCSCGEVEDSYAAMAELCRRPGEYSSLILSLASLYKEELALIDSVRRRLPHVEIWLTQTEGRLASLAEAMRLGADGLLAADGLHRVAGGNFAPPPPRATAPVLVAGGPPANVAAVASENLSEADEAAEDSEFGMEEPVLTADELRALLQETPDLPSGRVE